MDSRTRDLVLIAAAYALTRLPFLLTMPLILDEALYSVMFHEQSGQMAIIPTYLGHPGNWKPAPFFWVYGAMAQPFLTAGVPFDIAYRLPSFVFGLLSIPLLYHLIRRIGKSDGIALVSSLVFVFSGIAIYPQSTALADSASLFFILGSLCLYLEERLGRARFIVAGLMAVFAFLFKLVFAFIPGILALVAFGASKNREMKEPLFLLSLLMVPAAMLMQNSLLEGANLDEGSIISNFAKHLLSGSGIISQLSGSLDSFSLVLSFSPFWFALSLAGFAKYWGESALMSAWYLAFLAPLLSFSALPWYFLPALPAMAYFSALILVRGAGGGGIDRFFVIVFSMIAFFSLLMYAYAESELYARFQPEREAGLMVAGKDGVLLIGGYAPSVISYKLLTEEFSLGGQKDVGWIILGPGAGDDVFDEFISDYDNLGYNVTEGALSSGFDRPILFRKDSNNSRFDYVIVADRPGYAPSGYEMIYRDKRSRISLFRLIE